MIKNNYKLLYISILDIIFVKKIEIQYVMNTNYTILDMSNVRKIINLDSLTPGPHHQVRSQLDFQGPL